MYGLARPIALRKSTDDQQPIVPPTEGTDRPIKSVYKMSSKPRGLGNFQLFSFGVKV